VTAARSSLAAARSSVTAARSSVAIWVVLAVGVALLLRAPWFDAALGRDEAGGLMIANAWHASGPFAYGDYFLDRPPLLLALYRLAGDAAGMRILGALAASLLVVLTTLLGVRVAGRGAAPWAAAISAMLVSSVVLLSVFTPAELLAAVPSCASVLVLVAALRGERRRLWLFAGAGALAATALLVKQSFGDALVAGAVALAAGTLLGASRAEAARRAAAYAGGIAALVLALVVWALVTDTSAHDVWYAMFGFRLDASFVLTEPGFRARLSELRPPFVDSGLLIAALFAVAGIWRLRAERTVRLTLAAWIVAAGVGIVLGGSYWPHYLIALVPGVAVGAAALFERHRWIGGLAVSVMAVIAAVNAIDPSRRYVPDRFQQSAVSIGHYIRDRALPDQTAYAMYAKVNAVYYSGLPSAFPYNWSLMVRSVPGAEEQFRRLLASSGRPTWIVRAQGTRAFGLDRSDATKRLLARHYRHVATVCGTPVLLARGAPARPPRPPGECSQRSGDSRPI
jgi:4-amino-4-deoxy-L-arabinose transferase-like glycosyltransferase